MKIKFGYFCVVLVLFFQSNDFLSQSTVIISPNDAIEELIGEGIEYTNVVYSGDENQLGYLTGAFTSVFPMDAGIIMSSEFAGSISCQSGTGVAGNSGDPDLLWIANQVPPLIGESFSVSSVNDVCSIEFDFIPDYNTISYDYVFGSDEYLEWVNSSFNDVFAFFLSGPGIEGPYGSPVEFDGSINLAVVPDSDPPLPITVSSLNDVLNSEYYIDNITENDSTICVDGFTSVLTIVYDVIPGQTYHIRMAIADGSDTALASYMCMVGNSFFSFTTVDITEETVSFSVYPNPAKDVLNIETNGKFDIEILSMDGKLLLVERNHLSGPIDVESLAKGMYVVKLQNDDGVYSQRVLIE